MKYQTIEDTVYFWFASNDTSGSGDDGATPVYDVRLAGAAAGAAPVLSGAATLLSHGDYPDGCHEIAVAATDGNGFVAGNIYAVFCTLLVDSQNPSGFVGEFQLGPVLADIIQISSNAQRATDLTEIAQYLLANSVTLTDIIDDNSVFAQLMATNGDISGYSKVDDALQSIRDSITAVSPQDHTATANNETTGTLDSGTFSDTATVNNTYYQLSPVTPAVGGFGLNCDLTFNIGVGRVPSQVAITGYFNSGAQRTVQVWAYDYNLAAYVQISNAANDFGNTGSNEAFQYSMTQNMVQVSDGEVKIRFTSESITTGDNWYCDYVNVTSIEQAGGGLTADAIQAAVWARGDSGHDEDTLGYNLSKVHVVHGDIVSATNANQFIIDSGVAVNDAYKGMLIMLEDKTDDHYEIRRIVNYIGATKEIFVDRNFGFTPVANDDFYIMGTGYADVNTTHIVGSSEVPNSIVFDDMIWVDNNGTDSVVLPYGSNQYPTSSIANGVTICTNRKMNRIHINGTFTLAGALVHYSLFSNGHYDTGDILDINGQNIATSTLESIIVSGASGSGAAVTAQTRYLDCYLITHTDINGAMLECAVDGASSLVDTGYSWFRNCHFGLVSPCTLTVQAPSGCKIENPNGVLTLSGMDGGSMIIQCSSPFTLTIDSSCTGGTINIFGEVNITNNTGGTTVNIIRNPVNTVEIGGTTQTANDNGADIISILADTNELQVDWTDGGRLDLILDSALANTVTLLSRLSAVRAGYLDNLSLGAVALESTLTAIKGAGWTIETLKEIFDAIALISGGGDATEAKQDLILEDLIEMKGTGWVDENLKGIQDTIDSVAGLSGSNTITLTIQDGDANNIVEAAVEIWDSAGTTFYERKSSNASGQAVYNMDDGTYTVKIHKAGYTFVNQALVVSGNASVTYTGTAFNPGSPSGSDACRVYEILYAANGEDFASTGSGKATIVELPYDYGGGLHLGKVIDGTYDSETGILYWDIVRGSKVNFVINDYGKDSTETVPNQASVRLSDI